MAFPEAERVLYEINPLDEVICQLRFPPILRIEAEAPAGFQERVRGEYPFYETKQALKLPPGLPAELAQSLAAELPFGNRKSHSFTSRDQGWSLTLTREFLALTCGTCDRWENFRARLERAALALTQEYQVPFFTRIGLRYRNVIRRSRLGLRQAHWGDLLQPWISGIVGQREFEDRVEGLQTTCALRLPDEVGQVQMTFGLAAEERAADSEHKEREVVFLIDSDLFHQQQTECPDAFQRLDALDRQAGFLFRWCIRGRLHEALGPRPVAPA